MAAMVFSSDAISMPWDSIIDDMGLYSYPIWMLQDSVRIPFGSYGIILDLLETYLKPIGLDSDPIRLQWCFLDAIWSLWDCFRILFESYGILSWAPCDSFGILFGWLGIVLGSYADRMGLGWVVSLPPHSLEPESLRLGGRRGGW